MVEETNGSGASIDERLVAVLEETLGVPREALHANARLDEVAPLDSLSLAELAAALDDAFGIQVPGEELTTSLSVAELRAIVATAPRAG